MSFNLLASQCPAPQGPSGLFNIPTSDTAGTGNPKWPKISSGNSVISSPFNQLVAQLQVVGRYGAGVYGVLYGLALSTAASLNLPVAQGQIMCNGALQIDATTVNGLPDNTARVFIWAKATGVLTWSTSAGVIPSGGTVYIGNVTTSGGAITAVDYSGVMYVTDGVAWRQTADLGVPGDAPDAARRFFHYNASGQLFFWDGAAYRVIHSAFPMAEDTIPSGQTVVIPAGFQSLLFDNLTVNGHLVVNGKLKVI